MGSLPLLVKLRSFLVTRSKGSMLFGELPSYMSDTPPCAGSADTLSFWVGNEPAVWPS